MDFSINDEGCLIDRDGKIVGVNVFIKKTEEEQQGLKEVGYFRDKDGNIIGIREDTSSKRPGIDVTNLTKDANSDNSSKANNQYKKRRYYNLQQKLLEIFSICPKICPNTNENDEKAKEAKKFLIYLKNKNIMEVMCELLDKHPKNIDYDKKLDSYISCEEEDFLDKLLKINELAFVCLPAVYLASFTHSNSKHSGKLKELCEKYENLLLELREDIFNKANFKNEKSPASIFVKNTGLFREYCGESVKRSNMCSNRTADNYRALAGKLRFSTTLDIKRCILNTIFVNTGYKRKNGEPNEDSTATIIEFIVRRFGNKIKLNPDGVLGVLPHLDIDTINSFLKNKDVKDKLLISFKSCLKYFYIEKYLESIKKGYCLIENKQDEENVIKYVKSLYSINGKSIDEILGDNTINKAIEDVRLQVVKKFKSFCGNVNAEGSLLYEINNGNLDQAAKDWLLNLSTKYNIDFSVMTEGEIQNLIIEKLISYFPSSWRALFTGKLSKTPAELKILNL